jgi:AmmeMemoRadiSam system protein B
VAPHAGWAFSGQIALQVVRCFPPNVQSVVVVGGHMHPHGGVVAAFEEGYETPLGIIEADLELLELLKGAIEIEEDRHADNTVEIQLPLIRYLFPQARCLALRAAPSAEALALGEALSRARCKAGTAIAVLGSTDLTHYGRNYGFSPRGSGPEALAWVREVNDRRFIEAMVAMELDKALAAAARDHSACSAGGAVAAARFAAEEGCLRGRLLDYRTSHDVYPGDSFVGYAGIIYSRPA